MELNNDKLPIPELKFCFVLKFSLVVKNKKTLRDRRDGYMQYKRMMQNSPPREGDGCKMSYNSLHFCLGVISTQLLSYSL